MSLLFADLNLTSGASLVTYGTKKDVCLFTFREMMHDRNPADAVKVRQELEGKLEAVPVVKFRHSGAEIVISFDYIHKLAEKFPLPEKNEATAVEEADSNEG